MTRRERLRRVGILCCHCLRNLAFYRAWYKAGRPLENRQFWVNANGNFLDIAVLEWCKLFADTRGRHYFTKVVLDPTAFKAELLSEIKITDTSFDEYIEQMRTYRDKFVAHLDDLNQMQIPRLSIAKKSTIYLYDYLLAHEAGGETFHDAPKAAKPFYKTFLAEGKAVYGKLQRGGNRGQTQLTTPKHS